MENTTNPPTSRLAAFTLIVGLIAAAVLAGSLVWDPGNASVAAKDKKQANQQDGGGAADGFDPQRDYDQSRASDEIRAYHGAIFFARVDSLEREEDQSVAKGVPPHRVLTYLVTADRSLAGEVKGQVPIIYSGAYEETYENGGFGPLRIGERYLFFAGADTAGTEYYVEAGTGAILITSDRQETELVNTYRPLIAEADAHEQEAIARATAWADALQDRAGLTPTASIDPDQGPPGTEVTVKGKNYGFMEVTIDVGDDRTYADVAAEDGSFKTTITIPELAPPGPFKIIVDDEQGSTSDLTFTVTK